MSKRFAWIQEGKVSLQLNSDFETHAEEIYDNPKWPSRPLFYVNIPSKTDPSMAPDGCDAMFTLVSGPAPISADVGARSR